MILKYTNMNDEIKHESGNSKKKDQNNIKQNKVGSLLPHFFLTRSSITQVYAHVVGVCYSGWILSMTQIVKARYSYNADLCFHIDTLTSGIFGLVNVSEVR